MPSASDGQRMEAGLRRRKADGGSVELDLSGQGSRVSIGLEPRGRKDRQQRLRAKPDA